MKKLLLVLNVLFIFLFISCSPERQDARIETWVIDEQEEPKEQIVEVAKPRVYTARMRVVGDIMMHKWQLWEGHDPSSNSYNFDRQFELIQSELQAADITIGNLETTFGGEERGYSGYPRFNTPDSLASTLKAAGFDLLTTANNHSMDSNAPGALRTLEVLDELGIEHIGTYKSEEESENIQLRMVNGISFVFLSYTYGTNGIPVPKDLPYLVNLINIEKMKEDIKKAEELSPDFIVVNLHFGEEYQRYPNEKQKELVDELFNAGADIILGGHPHVIQPMEVRKIIRGDGTEETGFVIYSLGNFISSQRTPLDPPRDAGIILNLDFEKIDNEKAVLKGISFMPTWVQFSNINGKRVIRVIGNNLSDEELKTYLSEKEVNRLQTTKQNTIKHLLGDREVKEENGFYIYKIE
ncbi:CapA family protein [Defluviitalea saccharophila]|uniref:CapA family protein n=1 Tax=Defluviitalea saccharophila TaxID=879970 RepID=A0ABZ2Y460_9FIRM|nr:CapA family protein [Candidatus Epulonipiscium sp.]